MRFIFFKKKYKIHIGVSGKRRCADPLNCALMNTLIGVLWKRRCAFYFFKKKYKIQIGVFGKRQKRRYALSGKKKDAACFFF